jgi:hypothetical protein
MDQTTIELVYSRDQPGSRLCQGTLTLDLNLNVSIANIVHGFEMNAVTALDAPSLTDGNHRPILMSGRHNRSASNGQLGWASCTELLVCRHALTVPPGRADHVCRCGSINGFCGRTGVYATPRAGTHLVKGTLAMRGDAAEGIAQSRRGQSTAGGVHRWTEEGYACILQDLETCEAFRQRVRCDRRRPAASPGVEGASNATDR